MDEKTVIPVKYEDIARPGDPWVMVRKNGKWGWVNHRGDTMIPCRYDAATPFSDYSVETAGYATVCRHGRWFRINKNGKKIGR
jgi:hypothetical protein